MCSWPEVDRVSSWQSTMLQLKRFIISFPIQLEIHWSKLESLYSSQTSDIILLQWFNVPESSLGRSWVIWNKWYRIVVLNCHINCNKSTSRFSYSHSSDSTPSKYPFKELDFLPFVFCAFFLKARNKSRLCNKTYQW